MNAGFQNNRLLDDFEKKNLYLSQLKNYKSYNRINISCFLQLHLMERRENINANEYIIYKER